MFQEHVEAHFIEIALMALPNTLFRDLDDKGYCIDNVASAVDEDGGGKKPEFIDEGLEPVSDVPIDQRGQELLSKPEHRYSHLSFRGRLAALVQRHKDRGGY